MKRLALKGFVLVLPLLLWMGLVYLIDPFALFGSGLLGITAQAREQTVSRSNTSMCRDWALYKTVQFQRRPMPRVLFGDSRAFSLTQDLPADYQSAEVFNFGIPGANVTSIADAFWFASSRQKLERVCLQVSFHNSSPGSIIKAPLAILNSPLLYFFDGNVMLATLDCAKRRCHAWLKGSALPTAKDAAYAELFRGVSDLLVYRSNDEKHFETLRKVAEYCVSNQIEFCFLNMPMDPAVHRLIREKKLEGAYQQFKERLAGLGPLMDFDKENLPQTAFQDPLHLKREYYLPIAEAVIKNGQ